MTQQIRVGEMLYKETNEKGRQKRKGRTGGGEGLGERVRVWVKFCFRIASRRTKVTCEGGEHVKSRKASVEGKAKNPDPDHPEK
jgi:hypothetical protein